MGEIRNQPFQPPAKASFRGGFKGLRVTSDCGLFVLCKLSKCFELVRQLSILAHQHRGWSPFKNLCELWWLLTHLGMRREILEVLKFRPFDEIAKSNSRLAFKYVIPNYLARGFTLAERVTCFLHHYRRMHSTFPEDFLRPILQGDVTLDEFSNGVNGFAFTMGLPEAIGDREGELSLDLRVDGKVIFNLSFTIVPGAVVKSEAAEILLITRLQGTKGALPQIRLARKAFHEFFPGKLLLAALQGVADALGIGELEAVCATNQKSYDKQYAATFKRAYDDLLAEVGMVKTAAGFYSSPAPIKGRPLELLKIRNRSRAKKRWAIRQQIRAACGAFLLGAVDRAGASSACAVGSVLVPEAVEIQPCPIFCPTSDDS